MGHDEPRETFSVVRVTWFAVALLAVGAIGYGMLTRSVSGVLSLTGAGVVAIVNFRWLEGVLTRVLQPGSPQFSGGSLVRIAGRLVLFGVLLAALLWIPDIDSVAVALGISTLVVAVVFEGVCGARVGGG